MGRVEAALAALKIEVTEAKRGRLWARCVYHSPDNHPSWCIRVTKDRYAQHFCFACKSGGTLVDLVMHVRKVDAAKARAWLDALSPEEPEEEPEPLPEMVRLEHGALDQRAFRLPKEFIHEPLAEWVTPARRYMEKRGITPQQVEKWGLGYAVDGRLAGRIVVPTFTFHGAPAGYMARTFVNSTKRYLYPDAASGTDLDVMFGEPHWPVAAARRKSTVIVTEGAFNALAVERAVEPVFALGDGVSERYRVVAALGGSFIRPMHAGKIASFGEVVLFTDSDLAGDQAAAELTAMLVRHVPRIRRVRLPEGRDANDATVEELRCLLL